MLDLKLLKRFESVCIEFVLLLGIGTFLGFRTLQEFMGPLLTEFKLKPLHAFKLESSE